METKAELELLKLQEEYRKEDRVGIPMSVRERYWRKMEQLRGRIRKGAHQKKLGQILLEKKLISDEELRKTLTDQAKIREDKLIGEVLLEKGLITIEQLREAVSEQAKNNE